MKKTMKWFNHNGFQNYAPKINRSKIGQTFMVTCEGGYFHIAKYCQIAPEVYRFICKDGNRLVDNNNDITKVVIRKK